MRHQLLIAQAVVLLLEAISLLLQNLNIFLLLREFLLQAANLAQTASLVELAIGGLGLGVAVETHNLGLEAELVEDHDVGAVEDQGEEEREAAEVHVALGVELAGLHFHAGGATESFGAG